MAQSWDERNERARDQGYRNYYDYRVHNYGRTPPSEPAATGSGLSRLRGHRSYEDLHTEVKRGKVEMFIATPEGGRNPDGTYKKVVVTVVKKDGTQEEYRLKGKQMDKGKLSALKASMDAGGVLYVDTPSLDLYGGNDDEGSDWDYGDDFYGEGEAG